MGRVGRLPGCVSGGEGVWRAHGSGSSTASAHGERATPCGPRRGHLCHGCGGFQVCHALGCSWCSTASMGFRKQGFPGMAFTFAHLCNKRPAKSRPWTVFQVWAILCWFENGPLSVGLKSCVPTGRFSIMCCIGSVCVLMHVCGLFLTFPLSSFSLLPTQLCCCVDQQALQPSLYCLNSFWIKGAVVTAEVQGLGFAQP